MLYTYWIRDVFLWDGWVSCLCRRVCQPRTPAGVVPMATGDGIVYECIRPDPDSARTSKERMEAEGAHACRQRLAALSCVQVGWLAPGFSVEERVSVEP